MSKQAYYFPHDSNARNDEKILAVRMRLGAEGYGIYFMIIERLRESTGYMSVKDYNVIAFDLRVSAEKIKSVVEEFGLFEFSENGKYFFSKSLTDRMKKNDEVSQKRKEAAEKRWINDTDNQEDNANAMQKHSKSKALNKIRGDKSKGDKKNNPPFTPPSLAEVQDYFRANGYNPDVGHRAWQYYEAYHWKDSSGKAVKSWKQKMIAVWFKPEHKIEAQTRKMVY